MLSGRAAAVLNVLVGEYLQSATPVASDEIARSLDQKISSATVRNTMAQLTEDGYISRPHVSSGGVPSDLGYRFYVESLPEAPQLPPELRESVDRDLAQTESDIGAWSKRCAAILSRLTENLAIVTAPRAQFPRLKRIQLVFLQESTALLVLVLEEARLLRKILPFGKKVDQVQLDLAASRLNDSLGGLNSSQMQSNRLELNPLEEQVKEGSVSLMREAESTNDQEHYTDGLRLLLSQPEFSGGELARQLVQMVEDRALLERVLSATQETANPVVFIGEENREEFLYPFGVILCQYGVPQGVSGTVCVIGPKRMEYVAAIGGVRHLSAFMSQMVHGIQGNPAE
ncbi:MAG: heat-inducible transcription repressor HrcA [Chloroflexi bacterium]|nr:heat-inducible transcription repressor HrcA [Chloroflexota bacterium]